MNVIKAIRDYITKMVRSAQGMKVLLLDPDTTSIVSLVFSQSEILQEEVYLFERIDQAQRDIMAHLKAICFLRPTDTNIEYLKKELRKPKYGEYYLFFSNLVSTKHLEELAAADEHEVVQEVQEFYADYLAVNNDTFNLNLKYCLTAKAMDWPDKLGRITDGLASVCLSLKMMPYIRYQRGSELAAQVADGLRKRIESQKATGLWHFGGRTNPPLLLVLDRNDDPVSPLLTAWTYQAMVHQLIGIHNNRVDMKHVPDIREELQQIVLSHLQDPFFKQNMYKDFGDLGVAIKTMVDDFQAQSHSSKSISSIEDIKKFVDDYPEFRKLSGNVSKHVALMSELQNQVQSRRLLDVSEVEQELSSHHDNSQAIEKMNNLLVPSIDSNAKPILKEDAIRLVLLYALRYESESPADVDRFVSILEKYHNCDKNDLVLVKILRAYAGDKVRTQALDLFENKSWIDVFRGSIKRGLNGVTNIYTQHVPLLEKLFMMLSDGKLTEKDFPYAGPQARDKPTEVILFFVGGFTYEEAAVVAKLNSGNTRGCNYLIGGTSAQSPYSFLADLQTLRDDLMRRRGE